MSSPILKRPPPVSGDAVPVEDDLRHVAGELFSEERRGEAHLVGLHADDAEPVEEAPARRAVGRDEAVVGGLVVEDAARQSSDVFPPRMNPRARSGSLNMNVNM